MSFPTLYKFTGALKMPHPLKYDDTLIEFAINYRLCDNNMDDSLEGRWTWYDVGPASKYVLAPCDIL